MGTESYAGMLADAELRPAAGAGDAEIPWLEHIGAGTTIAGLIDRLGETQHANAPTSSPEAVLSRLFALESDGYVEIVLRSVDANVNALYEHLDNDNGHPPPHPPMTYVASYERNWHQHGDIYDFVNADDANGKLKAFERDIYLHHMSAYLGELAAGSEFLDAGCGVGRLATELVERRYVLTGIDASATALKCAARHLNATGASASDVSLHLCDVRNMSLFEDDRFDAVAALELISYQTEPEISLAEIVRVTAPGGLIFVSVEGIHGSLIFDEKIEIEHARGVLEQGSLDLAGHISVRYFTAPMLKALVEQAGLDCVDIIGTHYLPDGVLNRLVVQDRLDDPQVREQAFALELQCCADPVLRPLARAWLAVCRKRTVTS